MSLPTTSQGRRGRRELLRRAGMLSVLVHTQRAKRLGKQLGGRGGQFAHGSHGCHGGCHGGVSGDWTELVPLLLTGAGFAAMYGFDRYRRRKEKEAQENAGVLISPEHTWRSAKAALDNRVALGTLVPHRGRKLKLKMSKKGKPFWGAGPG